MREPIKPGVEPAHVRPIDAAAPSSGRAFALALLGEDIQNTKNMAAGKNELERYLAAGLEPTNDPIGWWAVSAALKFKTCTLTDSLTESSY